MSRRSYLLSNQRIDLVQRRRSREATLYSEQPIPLNIKRLPGAGEGDGGAVVVTDLSWMSPDISWTDSGWSWFG